MVGALSRTALLLGGIALVGCSSTISSESTLAKRLADRGPVPLSPDNPFIAANLLLNKEMERSPELKGFIDHRGQPTALEVERSILGAVRLTLFYPDKGERFELERIDDTWVISGPLGGTQGKTPIATPPTEATARVEESPAPSTPVVTAEEPPLSTPNLVLAERMNFSGGTTTPTAATTAGTPFSSPTHPELNDETARAALKTPSTGSGATAATPRPHDLPENRADLLARLVSAAAGRTAETSPRGDVVHYVTTGNETPAILAEWYTDSPLNGARIARMNGKRPTDPLNEGDSIVIPSYLVTNRNRLTDEAIGELSHQ